MPCQSVGRCPTGSGVPQRGNFHSQEFQKWKLDDDGSHCPLADAPAPTEAGLMRLLLGR